MNDKVLQLVSLSTQITKIKAEINEYVRAVAFDYIMHHEMSFGGYINIPVCKEDITWDIDDTGVVNCKWTSWGGGRCDDSNGEFYFTSEYLHNATLFEEFKAKCVEIVEARKEKIALEQRNNDLVKLNELKKKLGIE